MGPSMAMFRKVIVSPLCGFQREFLLVVGPHNGLRARSAPEDTGLTRHGLCRDIKGRARDWLAVGPGGAVLHAIIQIVVRLDRPELRLLRLPLVRFFETSFGRIDDKHFLLVKLESEGQCGFGECPADHDPYYSAETNETAWHVITGFLAPRILGLVIAHPYDVFPAFGAIRGHNMAKAAVEMPARDLFARLQGLPLSRVLGGTRSEIPSVRCRRAAPLGCQTAPESVSRKCRNESTMRPSVWPLSSRLGCEVCTLIRHTGRVCRPGVVRRPASAK